MIDIEEVLKKANEKYRHHQIHYDRVSRVNPKISGEVESLAKALVEVLNDLIKEEED